MEEILENVWRLPVPLAGSPLRELNTYLFKGKDRCLLLDTGFRHPVCREALFAGLEALDVNRERLDVVLTHAHSDHSGLAPEVVGPGRQVYLSRTDMTPLVDPTYWAKGRREDFIAEGFSPEELAQLDDNPAKRMSPLPFDRYAPLDEGDTLECGGHTLEAVLTPGHTPGHLCFYLRAEKVMFTGDHILFDITPNITNWPHTVDSLGQYLKSLDKIRAYEVQRAFPGHRERGDFYARIDALQAHHARRLGEALELVGQFPDSTAYELAGHMRWKVRGKTDSWADFPLPQKWFAVGEAQAHLDRLMVEGRITRQKNGNVWRYQAI